MRRFSLAVLLGFLLPAALWLAGFAAQRGTPTPSSRWVFEAYELKTRAAAAVSGPRVLIVAGSNALFGLDSAALAAAWGRPVVNLAVNAGLGLPYILWHARRVARAGDMILMPLEYSLLVDDIRPNSQIIDFAVARDKGYWRALPLWRQAWFAAAMGADRWWEGLRRHADPPITAGLYGAHRIGPLGDQVRTALADRQPYEAAELAASRVWDYGARARDGAGGWSELAAFAVWARAAGVCLAAVPPSLLTRERYFTDPVERGFFEGLPGRMAALGVPYFGRPLDFLYPADWFFNTDYHLHDAARREHTRRVAGMDGLARGCW